MTTRSVSLSLPLYRSPSRRLSREFYDAGVPRARNEMNFEREWIRAAACYVDGHVDGLVQLPEPGSFCCARLACPPDGGFIHVQFKLADQRRPLFASCIAREN